MSEKAAVFLDTEITTQFCDRYGDNYSVHVTERDCVYCRVRA